MSLCNFVSLLKLLLLVNPKYWPKSHVKVSCFQGFAVSEMPCIRLENVTINISINNSIGIRISSQPKISWSKGILKNDQ